MTAIIYEKLEASWLDGLPELSFDVRVQLLSRVAHQYIGHFGRAAPRTRQSYFFAIHEGFDEIRLHGWMLALNAVSEQMSARACFEYWAGYAEGRGVKVVTAGDCDMFYAYHIVKSERVYGYDDCPAYEDRTRGARSGAPYRYDED